MHFAISKSYVVIAVLVVGALAAFANYELLNANADEHHNDGIVSQIDSLRKDISLLQKRPAMMFQYVYSVDSPSSVQVLDENQEPITMSREGYNKTFELTLTVSGTNELYGVKKYIAVCRYHDDLPSSKPYIKLNEIPGMTGNKSGEFKLYVDPESSPNTLQIKFQPSTSGAMSVRTIVLTGIVLENNSTASK